MGLLVFAQRTEPKVDLAGLVRNATRYFDASLEVLEEVGPRVRVRLLDACFELEARAATEGDLSRARAAEERGKAAGMADLAARCPTAWEISSEGPEVALHVLCAIAASVALGPVLPPDDSTLYGVRGAMSRVEAIRGRSLQKA